MNRVLPILLITLFVALTACGGSSSTPAATTPAPAAAAEPANAAGLAVYKQYCIACHQQGGTGMAGMFPPLAKSDWVNGDKERIIKVVLNGQQGEIVVNGEKYNNAMVPHNFLTDQQIADVLTFVRSSFGNTSGPVTPAEVAALRGK